MNKNLDYQSDFNENLIYINRNILSDGEKYLETSDNNNSHSIVYRILKIGDELILRNEVEANQKKDIINTLSDCISYLEYLFTKKKDEEILCNSLEVIYDVIKNFEKSIREKKLEQIIFNVSQFMNINSKFRYPCLQCLKLLSFYLTPEYIQEYIKARNPTKYPSHSIEFPECIENVMSYNPTTLNFKANNSDRNKIKIEEEINQLVAKILEKFINDLEFKKLLKEFFNNIDIFTPGTKDSEIIKQLENDIKRMYAIINIKNFFDLGAEDILVNLRTLIEKEVK